MLVYVIFKLYTEALKTDDEDMRDDYYAARAQVLLKLERYSGIYIITHIINMIKQ